MFRFPRRLAAGTKSLAAAAIGGLALLGTAAQVQAQQNFGSLADGMTGQVGSFGALAGGIFSLGGLILLGMSVFKFKAYSSNSNDPNAKLTTAVGFMLAGVALIALPALMGTGIASLFGSNAEVGNLTGTNLGPLS